MCSKEKIDLTVWLPYVAYYISYNGAIGFFLPFTIP